VGVEVLEEILLVVLEVLVEEETVVETAPELLLLAQLTLVEEVAVVE
jgi:hypothetical protein